MYFNSAEWTQLLWEMDCFQCRLEEPTTSQGLLKSIYSKTNLIRLVSHYLFLPIISCDQDWQTGTLTQYD